MRALIVVDMQNDFMPGGPLGVNGARDIIDPINHAMKCVDVVVATQDWHPANHGSFAANHSDQQPGNIIDLHGLPQILWPNHCVQNTAGADFVEGLHTQHFAAVVRKGTDITVDSYSGFADNGGRNPTGLAGLLKERGVEHVYVCGVATDYCVRFTAEGAKAAGFAVTLLEDAARGVELQSGDVAKAKQSLQQAGVNISTVGDALG